MINNIRELKNSSFNLQTFNKPNNDVFNDTESKLIKKDIQLLKIYLIKKFFCLFLKDAIIET
ncbi:MAG: hypothetical protein RSG95_01915, partial [Bacilli bacterium]